MAIITGASEITFPDASTQSTAAKVVSLNGQIGVLVNTTLFSIGSYVVARANDNTTDYTINSTYAGSTLYAVAPGVENDGSLPWTTSGQNANQPATLINTGTWRCLSGTAHSNGNASSALFVRIS